MLFGRAQEEIDALQSAGITVEVVPGVTAALAASAQMGVSLTRRTLSRSVVFATPRIGQSARPSDWLASVLAADTAVLYMAYSELSAIARLLIAKGKSGNTPVAVVQGASLDGPPAALSTLAALKDGGAPAVEGDLPIVICLGEVYRELLDAALVAKRAAGVNFADDPDSEESNPWRAQIR
jgi:uroporphyrin-III C-methyltransferase